MTSLTGRPTIYKFQEYKPYTLGADNNPIFPVPLKQKQSYADVYASMGYPDEQAQFQGYLASVHARKYVEDTVAAKQHLVQQDEQTLLLREMRDSLRDFNERQRDELLMSAGITDPVVKEELERKRQAQIAEELGKRGLPYDMTSRTQMKAAILRSLPAPSVPSPATMAIDAMGGTVVGDAAAASPIMAGAMGGAEEFKETEPPVTEYAIKLADLKAELDDKLRGIPSYKAAIKESGLHGEMRKEAAVEYKKARQAEIEYYSRELFDVERIADDSPTGRAEINEIRKQYRELIEKNKAQLKSVDQAIAAMGPGRGDGRRKKR
jgi:hypothetical protein